MDTSTLFNNLLAASISALGAVLANAVSPPVTFEIGSGFLWGMGFGVLAGTAMWADARVRIDKPIEVLPLVIVMMMSSAAGFLGYTALSSTGLSALVVTGGTTVCGMLGGPGLRAVCRRGMSELNQALGNESEKHEQAETDKKDK